MSTRDDRMSFRSYWGLVLMNIDWVAVAVATCTSLVFYGMLREKVNRLEKDNEELRREMGLLVPMKHFDAVILPLRQTLDSVQADIKVLLSRTK